VSIFLLNFRKFKEFLKQREIFWSRVLKVTWDPTLVIMGGGPNNPVLIQDNDMVSLISPMLLPLSISVHLKREPWLMSSCFRHSVPKLMPS
jgi:hypothetical protein